MEESSKAKEEKFLLCGHVGKKTKEVQQCSKGSLPKAIVGVLT